MPAPHTKILSLFLWLLSSGICAQVSTPGLGGGVGVPGGGGVGVGLPDVPTNILAGYPNPYANEAVAYRSVYLYRAEEMGDKEGTPQAIWGIGFHVNEDQGALLRNFTIRMKQVNWTEMPDNPDTDGAITTFYGPANYTEHNGYNYHGFQTPFCWDGVSSILVEVCVTNLPDEKSLNAEIIATTPYTGTFMSYHEWNDDAEAVCDNPAKTYNGQLYESRPKTSFNFFPGDKINLVRISSGSPEAVLDYKQNYPVDIRLRNIGCITVDTLVLGYRWNQDPPVYDTVYPTLMAGRYLYHQFSQPQYAAPTGFNYLKVWFNHPDDLTFTNDTIYKLLWVKPDEFTGLDYNGREFWTAFMSNYDNGNSLEQSLLITSPRGANVTVSAPLLGWSTSFYVDDQSVYTLKIPNEIAAKQMANDFAHTVQPTSLLVEASSHVSVYGLSNLNLSTDAFLAVPYRTLGKEYRVIAPEGIYNASGSLGGVLINAPAEFVVVATRNNTEVEIILSSPTELYNAGDTVRVTLDQGENYLIKAKIRKDQTTGLENGTYDLTGTIVRATERIAVVSGSQCAQVPGIMSAQTCASCDHLLEQMTPSTTWGRQFVLSDFAFKPGEDIVRIYNGQGFPVQLTLSGAVAGSSMLPANQFVDFSFEGEVTIEADEPVQVVQMCTGGQCEPVSSTDPFYTNIIPSEQWGTTYSFATVTSPLFHAHYITIIKKSDAGRIAVDGYLIGSGAFSPMPGTDYYVGKIRVNSGSHRVVGDSSFVVYVYGFGTDDSYGYPASGAFLDRNNVPPLAMDTSIRHVSCHGGSDGRVTVSVSGGTQPYRIEWKNGSTAIDSISVRDSLPAGEYIVTVYDDYNYFITDTIVITEPDTLGFNRSIYDAQCFAENSGAARITPTGGTAPYQIMWKGGQTTDSIGLQYAGWHPFSITDRHNCFFEDSVFIDQPEPLQVSAGFIWPDCFDSEDGAIEVSPAGGTAPYFFQWEPSGTTNDSLTNIPAGEHAFSLADQHGCVLDTFFVLPGPDPLQFNLEVKPVGCYRDSMGMIDAELVGGYGDHRYSLDGGAFKASGLYPELDTALYILRGTDGRCTIDSAIRINAIPSPQFDIAFGDATCYKTNGWARGAGTGGSGSYFFQWITRGGIIGDSIAFFPAGDHQVMASDGVCTQVLEFVIDDIPPPEFDVDYYDATCDNNDGVLVVKNLSYDQFYEVRILPDTTLLTDSITGLKPGPYIVEVSDQNCADADTVLVSRIPSFEHNQTYKKKPFCGQPNGSIELSVTPGASDVSFEWIDFPDETSEKLSSIAQGTYQTVIKDSLCSDTITTVLPAIGMPEANFDVIPASCGVNSGAITVTVEGGSGNYQYAWAEFPDSANAHVSNLDKGTYHLQVDDGMCPMNYTIEVDRIPEMEIVIQHSKSHCDLDDGKATAFVDNASGEVHFLWSHNAQLDTNTVSGLAPGSYQVSISDGYCIQQRSFTIVELARPTFNYTVYPATCGASNGSIALRGTTYTGSQAFYHDNPANEIPDSLTNLAPGIYVIGINDGFCTYEQNIEIKALDEPDYQISQLSPEHCGLSDGWVKLNLMGTGTPVITWDHNNDQQLLQQSLATGWYAFTISDDFCTMRDSIQIPLVMPPQVQLLGTIPATCGENNGQAKVAVTGPESNYTVTWRSQPEQTGNTAVQLPADSLWVVASGSFCADSLFVGVDSIPVPKTYPDAIRPAYCYARLGAFRVDTADIYGSYSLLWDGIAIDPGQTIAPADSGWHYFTLTDDLCTVVDSLYLPEGRTPVIDSVVPLPERCELQNGEILVYVSDTVGTAWFDIGGTSQSDPLFSNLDAGNYTVTVRDNFCTVQSAVTVDDIPTPQATVSVIEKDACDQALGKAVVGNGDPGFAYYWDGQLGSDTSFGLLAGNHQLLVSNGVCDQTLDFDIGKYALPMISVSTEPDYCGLRNGVMRMQLTGETPPYMRSINGTGFQGSEVDSLQEGAYTLTVVDRYGCIVNHPFSIEEKWLSLPFGHIYSSPKSVIPPGTVNLHAKLPDSWAVWQWRVNDLSVAGLNPLINITHDKDVKEVGLYVVHDYGCSDSLFTTILPIREHVIYIPNAFSPDGDGNNDYFFISGDGLEEVTGGIYNRWGEEIFRFTGLQDRWDGTYKGRPVPAGVYNYKVVVRAKESPRSSHFGHVTLIR